MTTENVHIMVLDDNPASRYSTSRILRSVGWNVLEAAAGEEAVELAKKGTVDLFILDINLPDIDGFEVCRRIRMLDQYKRVPVIHLSATFVKDVDKVHGLEVGADGYLTHPVEAPVLIATVKAFLRARKAELEREELLAREQAARLEAERANRIKDDFLATLSHELRTPLQAMIGWAQLLKMGVSEDEFAEGLDVIEQNARAQERLISDLLDVSRITSGNLRLNVQQLDLRTTIDEAISTVMPAIEAKGIHLVRTSAPQAVTVSADPSRIQQVMWNLINNAVKFTASGGEIRVALARRDPNVEISVEDNGQGIDGEVLPQIFERFRQGDISAAKHHGSLGLGLAIVKELVELHGGTIRAESPGKGLGAKFTITLPAGT